MIVLSFDIGTKNMAFCILQIEQSIPTILAWEHFGIHRVRNDWCLGLCNKLDTYKGYYKAVSCVIIERQAKHGTLMRALQNYVHCYFVRESKPIHVVQAFLKLSGTGLENHGKALYTERKKAAVAICDKYLEHSDQQDTWKTVFRTSQRQHDLADALLQALQWCKVDLTLVNTDAAVTMATAKTHARRPTDKQASSGNYSKSNIKHIMQHTYNMDMTAAKSDTKLQKAISRFFPSCEACVTCLFGIV